MNILILGSGGVGLGLASCLLKSGAAVTLTAREQTVRALRQNGLRRDGIFGVFEAPPEMFCVCGDLSEIPSDRYDYILVCTKSDQVSAIAQNLDRHRHLLKDGGRIVHFQNGWGNAEKFLSFFPPEVIYTGRVITGFTRPAPNHVTVTVHADAIHIGSLFQQPLEAVEPLCRMIDAGGIPCTGWEDIASDLWAKMLYNCALNPLGAILNVPYGKLAQIPYTRELMNHIIDEIYRVMEAGGYTTYWPTARDYQAVFYSRLIPVTAEHCSSTLQDLQAGKKTEIEALTGQILEIARNTGIEVPFNTTIYTLIRSFEEKN